jgi:hypothetical protein
MNRSNTAATALLVLCSLLTGCKSPGARPDQRQVQQAASADLAAMQKSASDTAQTYKAMDNAALLTKLLEQGTASKEPFNSLAYRELETRTNVDPQALVAIVREHKNGDALLSLLLLRKLNGEAYRSVPVETRATVLTESLARSKTFNTWGLPHAFLEDASRAMLECGAIAAAALRRLLTETRPAPLFGGQESMEAKRYQYRLCDYALFFLERIEVDPKFVMPLAVADRDALIKAYLAAHGG